MCDNHIVALLWRSQDRDPPQVTARGFIQEGLPLTGKAFVFVAFLTSGDAVAVAPIGRDPQQVTARGFIQEGLPSTGKAFVFVAFLTSGDAVAVAPIGRDPQQVQRPCFDCRQ